MKFLTRKNRMIAIFTFTSTIIAGAFSMAFSKKVVQPDGPVEPIKSFYEIEIKDINGKRIELGSYSGKKVMIVNVASRCGYTSQYRNLQALYENWSDKIEIIAIPCNDYGGQEPGTNSDIKNFCDVNYGVTFTIAEKQNIKSKPKSPLYEWLSNPDLNGWNSTLPSWNFCKYIINEEGQLIHFLRSGVNPSGKEIIDILQG